MSDALAQAMADVRDSITAFRLALQKKNNRPEITRRYEEMQIARDRFRAVLREPDDA